MPLVSGSRVGPYEIVDLIGEGGMGQVYRARDTKLRRDVALKVLPAPAAHEPERRERFAREAQAIAALNHPGIVTIYSVEEDHGTSFLTMELVEGRPLSSVIPPTGLPLARVLDIAVAVIDAVAAAHQKGILHRDLKPGNIMIGEGDHRGRVKVLDFGLAKLTRPDEGPSHPAATTALDTDGGRVLGTVAYMSPEQAEGKPLDARSDLFSLGVVLYEMTTGRRPFGGESNVAVLSAILRDTPAAVTDLDPSLPAEWWRIIRRALAKDPERRYQTAKDLRNDIQDLHGSIMAPPEPQIAASAQTPPTQRLRTWMWVATGIVAAAVLAITWWLRGHPAEPATIAESAITMTPLTSSGTATLPTLSPDSKYVVYVENGEDGQTVWMRHIASSSATRLVDPTADGIYGLTVTPNGNYVDMVRGGVNGELWRVPFLGGPGRKVIDRVSTAPGWSPDGTQMAYVVSSSDNTVTDLVVADANGEHAHVVASRALPIRFFVIRFTGRPDVRPVWMPDGKSIAVLGNGAGRAVDIVSVDLATGRESVLYAAPPEDNAPDQRMGFAPGQDPSSFILNLQTPDGPAQLVRVRVPGGETTRITNDLTMYFGASRAGDAIATSRFERRSSLWVADTAGRSVREVGREIPSGLVGLAWAGNRLLYSAWLAGGAGVWSTDVSSGVAQLVVPSAAWARTSTTADGRTLFYAHGRNEIWKSGTDGSHPEKVPQVSSSDAVPTPDGATLFFISLLSGQQLPFAIDLGGGAPRQLSTLTALHGSLSVSPNGMLVTFLTDSSVEPEQIVMKAAGGPPIARLKLPGSAPHWMPDGQSLAYVDRTGLAIWVQPIAGGAPHQLIAFPDRPILQFAFSPDGSQLAISRATTISDIVLLRGVR